LSLPWVKVQISLIDNDTFKALSPGAKLTFFTALCLAQKQDAGGALTVRGIGPMTPEQISSYTGMRPKLQQEALDELCGAPRLMARDLTGCYVVERFDEKAGDESAVISHRDRQRRYREKKRDGSDASHGDGVTVSRGRMGVTKNGDEREDIDKDNSSSLRSDGSRPPKWVEDLRAAAKSLKSPIREWTPQQRMVAARYHCLEFGNCTKSEANNKARATNVARGFARMSRSKHYSDMTLGEYVTFARQVHVERDKTPWFDVWLIESVTEFESAA
jgi:hypothetical protein